MDIGKKCRNGGWIRLGDAKEKKGTLACMMRRMVMSIDTPIVLRERFYDGNAGMIYRSKALNWVYD